MDDRNRRRDRSSGSRNINQDYDDGTDYNGSRQAEQFEDSSGYDQDGSAQDGWRGSQMGDQGRRPVVYYEEVTWRAPSRNRPFQRDDYRAQGDRGRMGSDQRYYARDRDYGPARYDNGLDYYTSESQDGRDFSRRGGRSYGARPGYGYGQRSYGRRDRYGRDYDDYDRYDDGSERGFFEKAGDEIASWFGDEDAARRRRMDHRGSGPANYTRSDERILEDACDCLTDDWRLDARNIQVTVKDGEVTLDGTVDHRGAKRRAEDLVEDISGVGHVQNNLRVRDRSNDTESHSFDA
ncbi:SWFGD domain-containing protein [Tsuneonella sp. YG55]|uniref:SWFGD domain-containing protein n=1 Tax=Tsuneonella litorea TaxID=2976475 RepID=A0A9X3A752_9SPHN|nr:BON domain-containing protein [Tsuneonella litorea]MCT2557986.1 SWFGD domain-containing protein [Tsuneonella litorea]